MNKIVLASVTMAILIPAGLANGGDLGRPPPPPPPVYAPVVPVFTWTGFYIGGNVGGAWANGTVTESLFGQSWSTNHSSFIGGAQAGFNYQFGQFVTGAEWNIDLTSLDATGAGVFIPGVGVLQTSANTDWVSTLAARFGITFDRALLYGKAGVGWVNNNVIITNLSTGNSASVSNTNSGWLLGVGLEYAFTPNWTAKIEYDYLGLRSWTWNNPGFVLPADTFTIERNIQLVKLGINYKFGWGYPVAVRY